MKIANHQIRLYRVFTVCVQMCWEEDSLEPSPHFKASFGKKGFLINNLSCFSLPTR